MLRAPLIFQETRLNRPTTAVLRLASIGCGAAATPRQAVRLDPASLARRLIEQAGLARA